MAIEVGNQIQLGYIAEVTFGTTPATPTGKLLRFTSATLAAERDYLENPELRTDRQRAAGRGGVMTGRGEVSGVLSFATYDDLIEACLGGTWSTNVLKVGTARKSFTFQRAHLVNGLYYPFTGTVVNSMSLSGRANENVEITFGLVAAKVGNEATATIWSITTAANTNDAATTWEAVVKKGGSALGNVVGFSMTAENAYNEASVCGSKGLYDLQPGTIRVTGSLELYFDSNALYTDFRAENTVALQFVIGPGATKTYTLDLTAARITNVGAPSTGDGFVTVTVEFESFTHSADTALKITRTAS